MSENKSYWVDRTCTRILETGERQSQPLSAYRELDAYVLLSDPGMGKTESFIQEAKVNGQYLKADQVISELKDLDPNKICFIDALDEVRTIAQDALPQVLKQLRQNRCSKFRIACREAEWKSSGDLGILNGYLSEDKEIIVLHLDPLTDPNIKKILHYRLDKQNKNPEKFIDVMRQHHLFELLRNPLNLELLWQGFDDGICPRNRKEIYEKASRALIKENNSQHRSGKRGNNISHQDLLNAAGFLCAVQLLSGINGFALDQDKMDDQYFDLKELRTKINDLTLYEALKTSIFKNDGEEKRLPVHRTVAEYLSARYLAALVASNGLLFKRVLALMPSEIAVIVSDLRGLFAWFAVHCGSDYRYSLIERDPLGVVVYGDVSNFSVEEKKLILEKFKDKAQYYNWPRFEESAFGTLGTTDMIPAFRAILLSSAREEEDQKLMIIILAAIASGKNMPELTDEVEAIIRDVSYLAVIRANAVKTLKLMSESGNDLRLLKLAEDIRLNLIEDRDDEVLGMLLDQLYPIIITPREVLSYFHFLKNPHWFGAYIHFWYEKWLNTGVEDLPILLDQLVEKHSDLINMSYCNVSFEYHLQSWIGRLLIRGLKAYGNKLEDKQLYDWLGLGINKFGQSFFRDKQGEVEIIRQWFENHLDQYKSMITYSGFLGDHPSVFFERLQYQNRNIKFPAGIEGWCLEKAKLEAKKNETLAKYYFIQSMFSFVRRGVDEKYIEQQINTVPIFQGWFRDFKNQNKVNDNYEKNLKQTDFYRRMEMQKTQLQKTQYQWTIEAREHIVSIQNGSADPKIMDNLAVAYKGKFSNFPNFNKGREQLRYLLSEDSRLIEAAYEGFHRVLERKDLLSVAKIIKLGAKGEYVPFRLACLVSINKLYKEDKSSIFKFSDVLLSQLLAFCLTDNINGPEELDLVADLIKCRPAIAKEVFLKYGLAMFRAQKQVVNSLFRLVYSRDCSKLHCLLLEFLGKFPLRASKKLINNTSLLEDLLAGALNCSSLDKDRLKLILSNRLSHESMNPTKKIYWLSCGFFLDSNTYTTALRDYLGRSQTRLRDFSQFIQRCCQSKIFYDNLSEETIGFLIEILAPTCLPNERPFGYSQVTAKMQTADLIYALVHALQTKNSEAQVFGYLLNLKSLEHWYDVLNKALYAKHLAQGQAAFHYLNVDNICQTLENKEPSSPADLAAIVFDCLQEIAKNICDGKTDDKDQYWNDDGSHKDENKCRNALLSDLKIHLKNKNINSSREEEYADKKRPDIVMTFNKFEVPIEVKIDKNKGLWEAIHGQLVKEYTRNPNAGGYGIYVVFWFGGHGMKWPPSGEKPKTAKELEDRLKRTLSEEEKQRIYVCVIDCSIEK